MSISNKITKENPVFLYRLVNSSTNNQSPGSYKELICTLAWADKRDQRYGSDTVLRYLYHDKLHKVRVHDEALRCADNTNVFAVWAEYPDDKLALDLCRQWIQNKLTKRSEEINRLAWRTIHDRDFLYSLEVHDHVSEL